MRPIRGLRAPDFLLSPGKPSPPPVWDPEGPFTPPETPFRPEKEASVLVFLDFFVYL